MGNKLASPAFHLETFVQDLAGLSIQETLCNGRLLKTIKFANDEGQLVGKIYPKRFLSESLKTYIERLSEMKKAFYGIANPNVFPWQNYFETERAGYLLRQFFLNNLSDRIGTRPFLSLVEKKWMAYQLLVGLEQSHRLGICHGDIKCENVLCTSWNWIFLADFAPWKPTFIPQDDPADFSFFFDTSGRRTCYLAPERFVKNTTPVDATLTKAMDVFSVGCVIAELFLEGKHLFELGELLSYVKGEYDPAPRLRRIGDTHIEALVTHMIQRDPVLRVSAEEYLHRGLGNAFPRSFTFLHSYLGRLTRRTSDEKVHIINEDFHSLLARMDGTVDLPDIPEPPAPLTLAPLPSGMAIERVHSSSTLETSGGALDSPMQRGRSKMAPDKRDLLTIAEKLLAALEGNGTPAALAEIFEQSHEDKVKEEREAVLRSTLPGATVITPPARPQRQRRSAETSPLQLLLSVLCSSVHTLRSPLAKTTLLDLFVALAQELDDDSRMQRLVPYMRLLLGDPAAVVRASALRSLTKVLDMVNVFPPSESNIFPEYIIPGLQPFLQDPEDFVREVYAENLAQLAETAKRFLEKTQMVKQSAVQGPDAEGRAEEQELPPSEASYDKELQEIQDSFFSIVSDLLTRDTSSAVQRTLLADIGRFCRFFGKQRTIEFLLPVTTTFLNHRDWELRSAFFRAIVTVSSFVGMASLEPLLPLTEDALTKHDEIVVDKALNSVAALCELGLFRKHVLFSVAKKIAPMLCHPNIWIRHGVISAMAAIAKRLSAADTHCFLAPILRPYLLCNIVDINTATLLDCLKPALGRRRFEVCLDKAWELINKGAADTEGFDMAFTSALAEAGFPDAELETARIMRLYLRSVSLSMHSGGLSKSAADEDELANLLHLFQTMPVYGVPLPPTDPAAPAPPAKDRALLHVAPVTRGLISATAQLSSGADLNFANRKTEEEAGEILPLLPPPMPDLGTLRRFDNGSSNPLTGESLKQFRPKGTLVAHFHEHRGAVNQVCVSADGHFFVTGSDDFTAKVWDCQRLEKNVTNRSRLTFNAQAKVKALAMCENSHSVAVGCDNGTVMVFRVDYLSKKEGGLTRYTSCLPVKSGIERAEGPVVAMAHFNSLTQSLLAFATTKGRVHGWDLRIKKESWLMSNPLSHGIVQDFIIDPQRNWLLVGTSRGYITCWDMRSRVPVRSWRHPSKSRILRLLPYGNAQRGTWFFVASGVDQVDAFDVENGHVKQSFRMLASEDSPVAVRHLEAVTDSTAHSEFDFGIDDPMADGAQASNTRALASPQEGSYLLTAGTDKRVRYWDIATPANSYSVCGVDAGAPRPRYSHQQMTTSSGEHVPLFREVPNAQDPHALETGSVKQRAGGLPSMNHHDCVLDLKLLELPHKMLISSSRDGVVKVWK